MVAMASCANPEPLRKINKIGHIDQISFCMAIHDTGLPFDLIPSNLNYFVHFAGPHYYYNSTKPISLLHYHNDLVNVVGLLDPPGAATSAEKEAVGQANSQIAKHFNNKFFWEMRYANFSDAAPALDRAERILSTSEIYCWNRASRKHGQCSTSAAATLKSSGRSTSPDTSASISQRRHWRLRSAPAQMGVCSGSRLECIGEMVLCFEVLIHQESLTGYHQLIHYLAEKTQRILLVSGYERESELIRSNSMLFFYEPLSRSLEKTGKFESVEAVGRHTDVTIFRCETRRPTLGRLFPRWLRPARLNDEAHCASPRPTRARRRPSQCACSHRFPERGARRLN